MTREELFRAVGEVREDNRLRSISQDVPGNDTGRWRHVSWRCWRESLGGTGCITPAGICRLLQRTAALWMGATTPRRRVRRTPPPRPSTPRTWRSGNWTAPPATGRRRRTPRRGLVWLDPEEVLQWIHVIFRGVVRNLRYYTVTAGGTELSYTVASVEVTSSLRGDLAKGDICGVLYLGALGRLSTSIAGDLEDLEIGSEAIFMPFWATEETGWRDRGGVFLLR